MNYEKLLGPKYWVYHYAGEYQILQRRCLQQGWGLLGIYDNMPESLAAIARHFAIK